MNVLLMGPEKTLVVYKNWIEGAFDANVSTFHNLEKGGLSVLKDEWDLIVVDLDGLSNPNAVLKEVHERQPETPVFVISEISEGEDGRAVDAMRSGVSDFFTAPVKMEKFLAGLSRVFLEKQPGKDSKGEVSFENNGNGKVLLSEEVLFEGSSKMRAIRQVVEKILDTDLPILISGESGTGKEMIAQHIHHRSKRQGPFIRVNCAAIPSELLESELFGYERGAFTGAYRRKPGKFEAADGGFLFLDEISELSYPLQSKLLHVLQDGTVATLGSTREVSVNVRIIAATNQDLQKCVQAGSFRDDLFFRLNVVHLNVPPLRDRLDHLAMLIDHFSDKFADQYNVRRLHLSPEARSFLYTYPWPGNIRELENAIRRATVLGDEAFLEHRSASDSTVIGENVEPGGKEGAGTSGSGFRQEGKIPNLSRPTKEKEAGVRVFEMGKSLKEIAREASLVAEREAIAKVLEQTRWNRKKTARILDVSYKTLLTKIKETGLDEN